MPLNFILSRLVDIVRKVNHSYCVGILCNRVKDTISYIYAHKVQFLPATFKEKCLKQIQAQESREIGIHDNH